MTRQQQQQHQSTMVFLRSISFNNHLLFTQPKRSVVYNLFNGFVVIARKHHYATINAGYASIL